MLGKIAKPRRSYHDYLTPRQAGEMGRFLRALSYAGGIARQAGIKPDVSAALRAWSCREGKRYAERTTAFKYQQRERCANAREHRSPTTQEIPDNGNA
jgi:hypothetical protein